VTPGRSEAGPIRGAKVELGPGESREITITADPRLLARYDGKAGQWHLAGGEYTVAAGKAADALELAAEAYVEERRFGR